MIFYIFTSFGYRYRVYIYGLVKILWLGPRNRGFSNISPFHDSGLPQGSKLPRTVAFQRYFTIYFLCISQKITNVRTFHIIYLFLHNMPINLAYIYTIFYVFCTWDLRKRGNPVFWQHFIYFHVFHLFSPKCSETCP